MLLLNQLQMAELLYIEEEITSALAPIMAKEYEII
jgi:hypothetical protein